MLGASLLHHNTVGEYWRPFLSNVFIPHTRELKNAFTALGYLLGLDNQWQSLQPWLAVAHFSGVNTPDEQFQAATGWNWEMGPHRHHHVGFLSDTRENPNPRHSWMCDRGSLDCPPPVSSRKLIDLDLLLHVSAESRERDLIKMTKMNGPRVPFCKISWE